MNTIVPEWIGKEELNWTRGKTKMRMFTIIVLQKALTHADTLDDTTEPITAGLELKIAKAIKLAFLHH